MLIPANLVARGVINLIQFRHYISNSVKLQSRAKSF